MRRKTRIVAALLLLALFIGFFPTGTAAAYSPSYSTIRVGINGYRCWTATPSVTLYNSGGLQLGTYNDSRVFTASSSAYNNLRIIASGSGVTVTDGNGATVYTGSSVAVAPVNGDITTTYTLPGTGYADKLSTSFEFYGGFVATSASSSLTVVNYVEIEDYVKGVVPYEAIPSWPLETLKAQALCARTYAVANMGTYSSYGYDVVNTTYSQVYKGMGSANANTIQAVEDTAGQYILYDGSPISAVYSSCDGGATENVANVWGTSAAYLAGTTDDYEVTPANVQWSKSYTAGELYTYMRGRDSGFNLSNIASVSCTYTTLGNMYSVTFTDSNGNSKTYSKGDCRTVVLGGFTYNSQRFTITANGAAAGLSSEQVVEDLAYDMEVMGYTLTDDGELRELVPEPGEAETEAQVDDLYILNSETEIIAMDEAGLLESDEPQETETASAYAAGYTISNKGFGHNLGMSQYGAKAMADQGLGYKDIIHFYYSDVTIDGTDDSGSGGGAGGTGSTGFSDVPEDEWYYEAVQYVRENGLMTGVTSTSFAPATVTTRGMFVTILGRLAGVDELDYAPKGTVNAVQVNFRSGPGTNYGVLGVFPSGATVSILGKSGDWYQVSYNGSTGYVLGQYLTISGGTYRDVAAGAYYTPYVEWATEVGVAEGTGNGSFSPDAQMTRQEMCTLLYRFSDRQGISLKSEEETSTAFSDQSSIADWAVDAVSALHRAGVVEGVGDNRFEPAGVSTRAAVAQMMMRFHQTYM